MIWLSIVLIFLAGVAEHFKDLSAEGKLKGYWDKNHKPMIKVSSGWRIATWGDYYMIWGGESLWWRAHWLQGGVWDKIPVWIRQYLSFRDGWHLLKFFSVNLWAMGVAVLFAGDSFTGTPPPYGFLVEFIIVRLAFSLPETILRPIKWN